MFVGESSTHGSTTNECVYSLGKVVTLTSPSLTRFIRNSIPWQGIQNVALFSILLILLFNWARDWWAISSVTFDGWATGDWLISYDGGLVRRGLLGTILLTETPLNLSVPPLVSALQILLMGLLFGIIFILYLRTDRSLTWFMLILSPAVLLFPTLTIAGQQSGPRKEVIAFVALGIVALGYGKKSWFWWATAAIPLFVLSIFSHEATALLIPAFVFLVWEGSKSFPQHVWRNVLISCYAGLSLLALLLAFTNSGSIENQAGICAAWLERGISADCQGQALGSLTLTSTDVSDWFRTQLFPRYWGYLPVVALAIIPLYAVRFIPAKWKIAVITAAFIAPLFIIAWDYGRWIHLALVTLSILALANASPSDALKPMKVPLIAVAAYCLLWGFPGYSGEPPVLWDGWLVSWLETNLPTAWF